MAEMDNVVIGWASISKFKKREAYNPTVENSIYIRHDKLSNGIGTVLLEELIKLSKIIGYHSMELLAGFAANSTAQKAKPYLRIRGLAD